MITIIQKRKAVSEQIFRIANVWHYLLVSFYTSYFYSLFLNPKLPLRSLPTRLRPAPRRSNPTEVEIFSRWKTRFPDKLAD